MEVPTELNHISEELKETAFELVTSLQQMSMAIDQISNTVQKLAESGQTITIDSQGVHEKSLKTDEVVHYIDSIAKNTKLLGLRFNLLRNQRNIYKVWRRNCKVVSTV